ncbi:MAG: TetR/AcrR family transcriptional regulator [Nevskiales bacterium]
MRKGETTRQTILEQATRVASKLGLAGLTIGNLAEQTQLSKSGLYAHFRSKESLQLQVMEHATALFIEHVVRPALMTRRGEARVRALFDHWLQWCAGSALPGGCLFFAAAAELDDQPGPVRDRLVRDQQDLLESIAQIFRTGISEGAFRADAEPMQFAHELHGVMLSYSYNYRLLKDPDAEARTRRSFEALLNAARVKH